MEDGGVEAGWWSGWRMKKWRLDGGVEGGWRSGGWMEGGGRPAAMGAVELVTAALPHLVTERSLVRVIPAVERLVTVVGDRQAGEVPGGR